PMMTARTQAARLFTRRLRISGCDSAPGEKLPSTGISAFARIRTYSSAPDHAFSTRSLHPHRGSRHRCVWSSRTRMRRGCSPALHAGQLRGPIRVLRLSYARVLRSRALPFHGGPNVHTGTRLGRRDAPPPSRPAHGLRRHRAAECV